MNTSDFVITDDQAAKPGALADNAAKQAKIDDANARAGYWLGRLNEIEEAGKADTKAHQEAGRKAQYWLDRLNILEGYK